MEKTKLEDTVAALVAAVEQTQSLVKRQSREGAEVSILVSELRELLAFVEARPGRRLMDQVEESVRRATSLRKAVEHIAQPMSDREAMLRQLEWEREDRVREREERLAAEREEREAEREERRAERDAYMKVFQPLVEAAASDPDIVRGIASRLRVLEDAGVAVP